MLNEQSNNNCLIDNSPACELPGSIGKNPKAETDEPQHIDPIEAFDGPSQCTLRIATSRNSLPRLLLAFPEGGVCSYGIAVFSA